MAPIVFSQKFSGSQSLSGQLSVERGVNLFGKVCLVAAVGLAHAIGQKLFDAETRSVPHINIDPVVIDTGPQQKVELTAYNIINDRNIFGKKVSTEKPVAPTKTETKSELTLRLVGTNVSSSGAPFAIIENTTKKDQDVFELNETIFDQAKLVEVAAESVKIDHNGQVETLFLEDTPAGGEGETASASGGQTDFSVSEQELTDALANLPRLLSQARAVPYFRNGQSVGMRLFAIRQGSLYEKLGLKNGDIIRSVNNANVGDPAQALKLFEQLKDERSIGVELERNGEATKLNYSIR